MSEPRQIIEALRDIEGAIQRFSGLTTNELRHIEQVIFGWEQRLQQRQIEVEREYQDAKADLNACRNSGYTDEDGHYHAPICSAYEQRVYEIEQVLSKLYRLVNALNNAASQYRAKATQLEGFVDSKIPAASYWLRDRQQALETFERSGGGFSGGTSSGGSTVTSGGNSSGFGSESYNRTDHGIVNVSVSELPDPDFDENEFSPKGISWEDMHDGVSKLQEIQDTMKSGKGFDGDYWSQIDQERGLSNPRSYRNAYDAFYGSQPVRVEKVDGKYDVIGGRHRVWAAKQMGITHLPVNLIELNKKN